MPTSIGSTRYLKQAWRGVQNDINDSLLTVSDMLRGVLVRSADADDVIDPRRASEVLAQVNNLSNRYFVGADGRSPYARDGVTPLAEYPRILNQWLVWVQAQIVLSHAKQMQRALSKHPDVLRWFTNVSAVRVGELTAEDVFRPNPLADYEAAHTWVDPRGYRLSDRIWRVSQRTRDKLDALVTEGIREGRSASAIARDLEQFLLPNRAKLRTRKPYGRDASFDAMRLARTEISRAAAQAQRAAAMTNPFVTGIDWALSAQHPRVDICDRLATIGMSGERLREPYPKEDAPLVSKDSHPLCLCTNRSAVTGDIEETVAVIRAQMQQRLAPITPLATRALLVRMLGPELVQQLSVGVGA